MSDDLRGIVADFRKGILGRKVSRSRCFMVSFPLSGYLASIGIAAELRQGVVEFQRKGQTYHSGHFWIELEDGNIVDATADQFGLEPVYIGPLPDNYDPTIKATMFFT